MTTLAANKTSLSWFVSREAMTMAFIDSFRRLTPRYQMAQSGDVRRLHRQHPDDDPLGSRARGNGEAPAGFILQSPSGCG